MKKLLPLISLLLIAGFTVRAQNDGMPLVADDLSKVPTDSAIKTIGRALHILREFRIQAYVQAEWQKADSANGAFSYNPYTNTKNIGQYAGGAFPQSANNRFLIRRGRFKLSFEHKNAKDLKIMDFAFQIDVTERAFSVKDFYGRLIDPWLGWFSIQGGIFLRPFGFETPGNPAFYESPEFSRVNQVILPNEVELGEAIVIESPAKFQTVYLRLDAAIVNGDGIDYPSAPSVPQTGAYQSRKDFIGRIRVAKMWDIGTAKLGFNASGSYYNGGVIQTTNEVQIFKDTLGTGIYEPAGVASGQGITVWKRLYYGAQLELKADYDLGVTTLRGEGIWGQQPGTANSSSVPTSPNGGNVSPAGAVNDLYIRHFNGAMFYLTQTFKQKVKTHTIMHDITVKYDWYDPQDKVKQSEIGVVSNGLFTNDGVNDIKYTTIGIGYSIIPYTFFKLMIWYDFVRNASTAYPGFTSNVPGQNLLTIRTQFYIDTWWYKPKSKYVDNMMPKTW